MVSAAVQFQSLRIMTIPIGSIELYLVESVPDIRSCNRYLAPLMATASLNGSQPGSVPISHSLVAFDCDKPLHRLSRLIVTSRCYMGSRFSARPAGWLSKLQVPMRMQRQLGHGSDSDSVER